MKRINKFVIIIILLIVCLSMLASCQSADKDESFLNTSNAKFEFDSTSNRTKVIWSAMLTNNTIYNFNSFSVTFELRNGSTLLDTQTYSYDRGVKHGEYYIGQFNFYVSGKVDSIEYVSWTENYDTIWNTYKIWFIVIITLESVASLIYIIVMIIQDIELGDVGDFLSENWWVFFIFLAPIAGTIWGLVTSNWVPIVIILGGIIAFIVIALIAHLIKFTIEELQLR